MLRSLHFEKGGEGVTASLTGFQGPSMGQVLSQLTQQLAAVKGTRVIGNQTKHSSAVPRGGALASSRVFEDWNPFLREQGNRDPFRYTCFCFYPPSKRRKVSRSTIHDRCGSIIPFLIDEKR